VRKWRRLEKAMMNRYLALEAYMVATSTTALATASLM
jgi:hypothetical protein